MHLAQAHHHEAGKQKEHDVDQWDDLDPRFFVRNWRAYVHWIPLNRRAFPEGFAFPSNSISRARVCASYIPFKFGACVRNSKSKLDHLEMEKVNGNSSKMA